MNRLPPLDVHAHIHPKIDASQLALINGVVFAATRSLDEAAEALTRSDRLIAWGVGCHPGVPEAQRGFSARRFAALLDQTAIAGEIGLDGRSRVPLATQAKTLRLALGILQSKPRLASLHSFAATGKLVHELEGLPSSGFVLHWWLGNEDQTRQALSLGCYFSINASSVRRTDVLGMIPLNRVLTETDHPYGDHLGRAPHRPGGLDDVEAALARHFDLSHDALRTQVWRNLDQLVRETRCAGLLPRSIRSLLAVLS